MTTTAKSKPTEHFQWSQGSQKVTVGRGVCFGLCKKIGQTLQQSGGLTGENAYKSIVKQLGKTGTLQSASGKQATLSQSGTAAKPPFPTDTALIVFCNISVSEGFCSRYSLGSYLYPWSWIPDHACLLRLNSDGSVVLFDPNWGVSRWDNMRGGNVNHSNVTYKLLNGLCQVDRESAVE
ncbi:hypothetical protein AWB69_09302 [Caballeronia udeis]|uniref:Uncharacterized protein n=1 Tax=Caballeronia udeis TaxID=1232866 RepID=A0A158K2Y9_9BURK|nr:hypothetical protein AWB69_09302 [Caballeronia udeis]